MNFKSKDKKSKQENKYQHTEERKQKMSLAAKQRATRDGLGHLRTPEVRIKIKEKLTGRNLTVEHREVLSKVKIDAFSKRRGGKIGRFSVEGTLLESYTKREEHARQGFWYSGVDKAIKTGTTYKGYLFKIIP